MHICSLNNVNGTMNIKWIRLLAFAAMLLAVVSCKDDDETDYEYMSGNLVYDMPTYAVVNQEITSYVTGITTPSSPRYFWVSHDIEISDTDTLYSQSITFTTPSVPGKYSITVFARADGYYSTSSTSDIQVINADMSQIGGWLQGSSSVRDSRDGEVYRTEVIGSLEWFIQDLRYDGTESGGELLGRPYDNSEGIDNIFGRLYSWNDATGGETGSGLGGGPQGACPEGWSVPTAEDWEDLALATGGAELDFYDNWPGLGEMLSAPITIAGSAMWPYSPDNMHTNTVRWNGFPNGNSRDNYGIYENIAVYGMWWSSSEMDNGMVPYRYMFYNSGDFNVYYTDKESYGVSVRCVRLAQGQ